MDNRQKEINDIIESIIIQAKESWGNDYKIANKHFKIYTEKICKLLQEGNKEILTILIKHNEPSVRKVGAYFLLPIDKKMAEKELKLLFREKENGVGFNAKTIFQEWKKKRLEFPKLVEGKIVYCKPEEIQ